MEHENTSYSQPPFTAEPLSLPHFDEAATLQSARPVVPLHEVKVAARSRRRLLIGAALCFAVIVGALTATFINNQLSRPEESATATVENPSQSVSDGFVAPAGEATGSSLHLNESAELERVDVTAGKVEANSRSAGVRKETVQSPHVRRPANKVVSPPVVEERDDQVPVDEMEISREQQREVRRLRRERRINTPRADDGLTRIREIFEGSPRP